MGLFTPKADEDAVTRAVSRLTGENLAMRLVIGSMLKHMPERDAVLADVSQLTGVLTSNVRHAEMHPLVTASIKDTLEAIRRMA